MKNEEERVVVRTALMDPIKIKGSVDVSGGSEFPTIYFWAWGIVALLVVGYLYLRIEQDRAKYECTQACAALFAVRVESGRYGCFCEERDLSDAEGEQAARRFQLTMQMSD